MQIETLILIIQNDLAFLTPAKSFTLKELRLDTLSSYILEEPIAWKLRIRRYFEAERRLSVDVEEYEYSDVNFLEEQLELADWLERIETISFKQIATTAAMSSFTGKGRLRNPAVRSSTPLPKYRIRPVHIDKVYKVPFEEMTFVEGGVTWTKRFSEYPAEIELFIPNPNIEEEFDAVKGYFAKVLKAKHVKIKVKAEVMDGQLTLKEVSSPEIDQIDEYTLDKARFEIYNSVKRGQNQAGSQDENGPRILEEDELLAELNKDLDLFTAEEIVDQIAELEKSLHYLQLSYLVKYQVTAESKLLFVTKPSSFIFTIENLVAQHLYVIWETVDTEEATYIWEYPQRAEVDLSELRRKVESTVQEVLRIGKSAYINRQVPGFYRVMHNYTAETDKQGFAAWLEGFQKITGKVE